MAEKYPGKLIVNGLRDRWFDARACEVLFKGDGELLFWVGEDEMLFGSDYGVWEPKWQVEGFLGWDYPDDAFLIIRV